MKTKYNILALSLLAMVFTSCDPRTNDVDPSDLGSTDHYPTITVTPSVSNGSTVTEGSSITFDISMDRSIDENIDFVATLVSGTVGENDIVLGSGRVAAYSTTTSVTVNIIDDSYPEIDENATIKIEAADDSSDFWLNPQTVLSNYDYTIQDPVNPDLIVVLEWDYDAAPDLDMFAFNSVLGAWDYAATADTPEIKNIVWGSDPDGTYYIGIDPYEVTPGVALIDYTFVFGTPDGSVSEISGTFDYENRNSVYSTDSFQGTTVYLLVQVDKTGSDFVMSSL